MGLASLDAAVAGLNAAQRQMDTIATNIANASTEGYTRKTLPQYTRTAEGIAIGVQVGLVTRDVDLNLSRDLWTQTGLMAQSDVREAYLARIESFHGAPEAESSIAAKVTRLEGAFVSLADSPEDSLLQNNLVARAREVASGFQNLSGLVTTLRNDAQGEMDTTVARINDLLTQIADANNDVQDAVSVGRTSAGLEDRRDQAITELAALMDISFFQRGDGVLVIQSSTGVELASETARQMTFASSPLGAASAYPDSAAPVYVGDPVQDTSGVVDITTLSVGGKLGGLISLRDTDLPQITAQLDEFAHKLASRLDGQGLRLFTDRLGIVPANTNPDPNADPVVSVAYVGFAEAIQVNTAVAADPSLVQQGTADTDLPVAAGSAEVIQRVIDFAFGTASHEQATGTVDIRATAGGAADLREWLGVHATNRIEGTRDIGALGDLIATPGSPFNPAGADTFRLTLDPAGESAGPINYDIDMNAVLPAGSATAADLATHITALHADLTATIDTSGRLVITSPHDIALSNVDMGAAGFSFLGLAAGTYNATDPYLDVQVGGAEAVRITIPPGMDEAGLIDALILDPAAPGDTGVPGLAYDAATYAATGALVLRPGDDFDNPAFGGGLRITSGPFTATGAGGSGAQAGVNLTSALFGSYDAGPPVQDLSPVAEVAHDPFRETEAGPLANITPGIRGALGLADYGQKVIDQHSTTLNTARSQSADAQALHGLLESDWLNTSTVNVDEELALMIQVQSAFAASAKVITTIQRLFDELLDVV